MGQYFDFDEYDGDIHIEFSFNNSGTRFGIGFVKQEGQRSGWWFTDASKNILENGKFTHEEMLKLKRFFKDY